MCSVLVQLVFMSLLVHSCQGHSLGEILARLDVSESKLKSDYESLFKRLFDGVHEQADALIAQTEAKDVEKAYAMKKMSNTISIIESIRYGAKKNALAVAREIIEHVITPEKVVNEFNYLQSGLLVNRVMLRSTIDGIIHTEESWKDLHLTISYYGNPNNLDDPVSKLALQIYDIRDSYGDEFEDLYQEQERLFEKIRPIARAIGEDFDDDEILDELDETIESVAGCESCREEEPDEETHFVSPMFGDEAQLAQVVEKTVGRNFLKRIRQSNWDIRGHVKRFSVNKLLNLDMSDIDDLEKRYRSASGQGHAARTLDEDE